MTMRRITLFALLSAGHGLVHLSVSPESAVAASTPASVNVAPTAVPLRLQSTRKGQLPIGNGTYTIAVEEELTSAKTTTNCVVAVDGESVECMHTFPKPSWYKVCLSVDATYLGCVGVIAFEQPVPSYVRPSTFALAGADYFTVKLNTATLPVMDRPLVRFADSSGKVFGDVVPQVLIQDGSVFLSGRTPFFGGSSTISDIGVSYALNGKQFTRVMSENNQQISATAQKPYKIGFIYHEALTMENGWIYQQNLARIALGTTFGNRVLTVVSENKPDKGPNVCGDHCDGADGWCTKMSGCAGNGLSHQCYIEGKRMIEEEGVDMVVGVTFWYWPDLVQLAKEYPDKKFLSTAPGSPAHLTPNLARGWLRRYQANYMMGYVLGHMPAVQASRRVGYVASFPGASKIAFGAFMKGLQEASGLQFQLFVTYTFSWGNARREKIATERFFKYYNVSAVGTICNSFQPYWVAHANNGYSVGNNIDVMQTVGPSVLTSLLFSWEKQVQTYVGTAMSGIPWGDNSQSIPGAESPPLYTWSPRSTNGWVMGAFSPLLSPSAQSRILAREADFAAGNDDIWCGTLRSPDGSKVNTPILDSADASNPKVAAGECMGANPSVGFNAGWGNIGIKDSCQDSSEKINDFCYVGIMNRVNDVPDTCPSGMAITTEGCTGCPLGKFAKLDECVFCPEGRFGNTSGLAECYECPSTMTSKQKYSAIGSSVSSPSEYARQGHGMPECEKLCAADEQCVGFFFFGAAATGACWTVREMDESILNKAMVSETRYNFNKRLAISECEPLPCPVGQSSGTVNGVYGCTVCALGSYSSGGFSNCTSCPSGLTTAIVGAASVKDCYCKQGTFHNCRGSQCDAINANPQAPGFCQSCPKGAECKGPEESPNAMTQKNGQHRPPHVPAGFMSIDTSVYDCGPTGKACPGSFMFTPVDQMCAHNGEGIACAICPTDYYWYGNQCELCDGGSSLVVIMVALALFLVVGFFIFFWNERSEKVEAFESVLGSVTIGVTISFMQSLSVFSRLNFAWPIQVEIAFDIMRLFIFELEALSLGCVVSDGVAIRSASSLVMPIVIIFAFLSWFPLSQLFNKLSGGRFKVFKMDAILNALGMILQAFYISIVLSVAKAFDCYGSPNGERTLRISPSDVCWQGQHIPLVIISAIAALVYVAGFFAFLTWVVIQAPIKVVERSFSIRYKFVFFKYSPTHWWFGLAMLVRSICISLVSVVSPDDGYIQFLLMLFILVNFGFCHLLCLPYSDRYANMLETSELGILIVILGLGSWFIAGDSGTSNADLNPHMADVMSVLLVALLIACVLMIALVFVYAIHKASYPEKSRKKLKEKLEPVLPNIQAAGSVLDTIDEDHLMELLEHATYLDVQYLMNVVDYITVEVGGIQPTSRVRARLPRLTKTVRVSTGSAEVSGELRKSVTGNLTLDGKNATEESDPMPVEPDEKLFTI